MESVSRAAFKIITILILINDETKRASLAAAFGSIVRFDCLIFSCISTATYHRFADDLAGGPPVSASVKDELDPRWFCRCHEIVRELLESIWSVWIVIGKPKDHLTVDCIGVLEDIIFLHQQWRSGVHDLKGNGTFPLMFAVVALVLCDAYCGVVSLLRFTDYQCFHCYSLQRQKRTRRLQRTTILVVRI